MRKNLIISVIGSFILLSCGQGKTEKGNNNTENNVVFEQVALDSLITNAENYVNKNVSITGTVTHVCKHGGQKMFLFNSSDTLTMKITTGENYSEFKVELEGSTVNVEGILREQRIDETYLAEWEAEVKQEKEKELNEGEEAPKEHVGGQMGDHERSNADMEKIQQLREKIESSEKGYLSNFSVECVKYTVVEDTVATDSTEQEGVE